MREIGLKRGLNNVISFVERGCINSITDTDRADVKYTNGWFYEVARI